MTNDACVPVEDLHPRDNDEFDFSFRTIAGGTYIQALVTRRKRPLFIITLFDDISTSLASKKTKKTKVQAFWKRDRRSCEKTVLEYILTKQDIESIFNRIQVMTGRTFKSKRDLFSNLSSKSRDKDYYARKIIMRYKDFVREQKRIS